jgi:hypothetical protein
MLKCHAIFAEIARLQGKICMHHKFDARYLNIFAVLLIALCRTSAFFWQYTPVRRTDTFSINDKKSCLIRIYMGLQT